MKVMSSLVGQLHKCKQDCLILYMCSLCGTKHSFITVHVSWIHMGNKNNTILCVSMGDLFV